MALAPYWLRPTLWPLPLPRMTKVPEQDDGTGRDVAETVPAGRAACTGRYGKAGRAGDGRDRIREFRTGRGEHRRAGAVLARA